MTTKEVADILGINESTAALWARKGKLPARWVPVGCKGGNCKGHWEFEPVAPPPPVPLKMFSFRRGIPIRRLLYWCNKGLLPAKRVGREWRIESLTVPAPSFTKRRLENGRFVS